MKKLITLVMLISITYSLQAQLTVEQCKAETAKINAVLDKYITANETQNIRLIEEIWAIDEDIEAFGTAAGERLQGWDAIRKVFVHQFNSFTDTYISARNRSIHIDNSGNFAWVSQILNYNYLVDGVQKRHEGIRYTAVLIKTGNDWKMVQMHLSLPH